MARTNSESASTTKSVAKFTAALRGNKNDEITWGNPTSFDYTAADGETIKKGDKKIENIATFYYEWGWSIAKRHLYVSQYTLDSTYEPFGISSGSSNDDCRSRSYSAYYLYGTGSVTTSVETAKSNCGIKLQGTYYFTYRKKYKNTYNLNGGSGQPSSQTVYAGINYNLTTTSPTRTGYTFGGWKYGSTIYSPGQNIGDTSVSGNRTYTAVWTPNTYLFNINIMNPTGSEDYASGTMDVYYSYNNTTYYSQTNEPVTTSTIPYDTYLRISNIIPAAGMSLSSVTCTHTDNMSQSGGTYTYTLGGVPSLVNGYFDEITIQMRWADYTVSFNSNGGTSVSSKTVTYKSTYGSLSSPTKGGYTFAGWYKESSLSTPVSSSTTVDTIGNHTLYAKWTPNTYLVDINILNPSGSQDYVSGTMNTYYADNGQSFSNTTDQGRSNITYNTTLTISNIIPASGYILESVTCDSGRIVNNGNGTYTYTATMTGVPSGSWDDSINIRMKLKEFYININILSPNGAEDGISGLMDLRYSDGVVAYNVNNENQDNGHSKGIKYQQTIVISNIRPMNNYALKSVTCNYGTIVDNGNGSWTYTATMGGNANLTSAVVEIKMTYLHYDETEQYYYFEDGEYPQTYVGDAMNSTLSTYFSGVPKSTYDLTYNDGETDLTVPVYTYTDGKKYARVSSLKDNDKEWVGTGSNFYYLSKNYAYRDKITVNVWACMENWNISSQQAIISWTNDGGWNIYVNPGSAQGTISSDIMVEGEGYTYRNISYGALSNLSSGWHMFTLTFDGRYIKTYTDGAVVESIDLGSVKKIKAEIFGNDIVVGAECGYNEEGTPNGANFVGKVKNVQIRNMSLSGDNVKELYNKGSFGAWFKVEPIRWRASDYGVLGDYIMNTVTFTTTTSGWEILGQALSVKQNTNYTISVKCKSPTFVPLAGYSGLSIMVLSSAPTDSDCSGNMLTRYQVNETNDGFIELSFNSGSSSTVYLIVNGGTLEDYAVDEFQFSSWRINAENTGLVNDMTKWTKYFWSPNINVTVNKQTDKPFTLVSDKVLAVSTTTQNKVNEGWAYTEGNLYKNLMDASGKIDLRYATTDNSVIYSKYGEKGQIQKVDNINPNLFIPSNASGNTTVNSNIYSAEASVVDGSTNRFSYFKVQIWTTSGGLNQVLGVTKTGRYDIVFTKDSNTSYIRLGFNGNLVDATINYTISGLANGEYTFSVNLISFSSTGGSFGEIKLEIGTKYTGAYPNVSGIRTVSKSELEASFTDLRAKGSDLVCFLLGTKFNEYVDYWTRDLQNLGTGYVCTKSGNFTSKWLNSVCGVRFAVTLNGSYRK